MNKVLFVSPTVYSNPLTKDIQKKFQSLSNVCNPIVYAFSEEKFSSSIEGVEAIFTKKNKNRKMLFYEIPLLIESNLMKYFNIIIFVKAKRNFRLKRFKSKNGDLKLFNLLDKKQLNDNKKIKFCDYVVVNEKNLKILKIKLLDIISKYE